MDIEIRVRNKFNKIVSAYGSTFPLDALLTYITLDIRNNKTLHIKSLPLPMHISGFCVGLADCDLIGIRVGLDEHQRLITTLHELSHFILKHVKLYANGEHTKKLDEFISLIDLSTVTRRDTLIGYSTEIEQAAESLATLLSSCIIDEGTTPTVIRDLYRIRR